MSLVSFGSATSRRIFAILGLAAFVSAASVARAQDAPADGQTPATPAPAAEQGAQQAPEAPAAEDAFRFTSGAAVIIWQIKPELTSDFESVWNVIRSRAAAAVDSPEAKAIVDSMTLYKQVTPGQAGVPVAYFFQVDPVVRTATYDPTFLLYSSGLFERPEAEELFQRLSQSINPPGINPIPLQKLQIQPVAAPVAPPSPAVPPMAPSGEAAPPAGGASPQ
jgi:hypothetical protein